RLEGEGIRAREGPATIPSHSARVEPLREELLEVLAGIAPRTGEIPFYSTGSRGPLDTPELDAEYRDANPRQPVLFEQVARDLLERGQRAFVEVSPHPVFALALRETIEDALEDPDEAAVLGTLRRDEAGPARFAFSLAEAHVRGVPVDWASLLVG